MGPDLEGREGTWYRAIRLIMVHNNGSLHLPEETVDGPDVRFDRFEAELLDEVRREVIAVGIPREELPHLVFQPQSDRSLTDNG